MMKDELKSRPKKLNWLTLILILQITFLLISDVTAGKIVFVAGYAVSISVLYFPVTYILSDIITEVYGYIIARQILWLSITCSFIAGITYQLAAYYPMAFQTDGIPDPYHSVFSIVPRVMIAGWIAVFCGDIVNNYILAKMKIWTRGRYFWARALTSTIFGQLLNTILFYSIALIGVLPFHTLLTGIISGWIMKVSVEFALLPITTRIVNYLKHTEGQDVYDLQTNFNPFILK